MSGGGVRLCVCVCVCVCVCTAYLLGRSLSLWSLNRGGDGELRVLLDLPYCLCITFLRGGLEVGILVLSIGVEVTR